MCPCNADIMTSENLLQHCHLHDALKLEMWPEPTQRKNKLYGNLEELRTAAFVRGDRHLHLAYIDDEEEDASFVDLDLHSRNQL